MVVNKNRLLLCNLVVIKGVIKVAKALRWERALKIGKQRRSWFAKWGLGVLPRGLVLAPGLLVSLLVSHQSCFLKPVLGGADVAFLVCELHWLRACWHHPLASPAIIAWKVAGQHLFLNIILSNFEV